MAVEFHNKILKEDFRSLGSNFSNESLSSINDSLDFVGPLMYQLATSLELSKTSGFHRPPSKAPEIKIIIDGLEKLDVNSVIPGMLSSFVLIILARQLGSFKLSKNQHELEDPVHFQVILNKNQRASAKENEMKKSVGPFK